jgi:hypothetical protein
MGDYFLSVGTRGIDSRYDELEARLKRAVRFLRTRGLFGFG